MATFTRPEIIRPPSEHASYFLPLTSGCSNNTCTFCAYYGSKLQIRRLDEIKREIDALALYMKSGITIPGMPQIMCAIARDWDGKRIFLQDGDALVYPTPELVQALEYINSRLPSVERVAAYSTAQDILRISTGELKELKKLKLGIVYMGLESGDDDILLKAGKRATSAQMIEACRKAKEAGILTSVTVILGLAGEAGSEKHCAETARVLTEMDPDYVGALTLTLVPGTPLHGEWQSGRFTLISPFQSLTELLKIISNSNFTRCLFSSMHASNYLAVRGSLPEDKDRVIRQLRGIIESGEPSLLRPEFLRGL